MSTDKSIWPDGWVDPDDDRSDYEIFRDNEAEDRELDEQEWMVARGEYE